MHVVLTGSSDDAPTLHVAPSAAPSGPVASAPGKAGKEGKIPTLWTVISLCMGLSVVMTFAELILGPLGPAFEQDIGVAATELGLLMGIFFIFNGLAVVPAGLFADKFDSRITIGIQVALGVGILAAFAFATEPIHLYILCALSGAALGLNGPIVNRIIVDFVVVESRAKAIAWKSFGFQVAGVLTGLIFGATASFMDWRQTVLWCAALLVPFGIWGHFTFRHAKHAAGLPPITVTIPIQTIPPSPEAVEIKTKKARRKRRAAPIIWWLVPYSLLTVGAFTCVATYMVFFGWNDVGISAGEAAVASGVAATVSLGARFLWVHWLNARNEVLHLALSAFTSAFAVLVLALSPFFGRIGFWVAAILIGLTLWATGPVAQVAILRNAHPRYIGRVSSVVMVANSASLAGMPLLLALLINVIGLHATWFIVVGLTALGGLVIGVYALFRHLAGGWEAYELKLN